MTPLHRQVRRTISRYDLCPGGTRVLVALSGGSDSMALTLLLRDLEAAGEFRVVSLAHLNHQLRPSADRDEQFCRAVAAELELPIAAQAIDAQAYATARRLSIEDAARRLRYEFFHREAARTGADRVAVGHTLDDQAETLLLKLTRGAGLTGLGGIHPRRGPVIRPLLEVSRAALRRFLEERGQRWVEDDTNLDLENPRNRIRHVVLPELDRAYGGPTRPAIARAAMLLREDGQWLDEVSRERLRELSVRSRDGLEIDAPALRLEPVPVRRRVLLAALRTMAGEREVGLGHVETALEVLAGSCRAADVPGSRVELRGGKLVLVQQGVGPK